MLNSYSPVTHVIFDMDGLLINTDDLYFDLFSQICKEFGGTLTREISMKCSGRKLHEGSAICIDELNLTCTVEQILNRFSELQNEYLAKAQLMPGAERLIEHFDKNNIPMGICTGSTAESFNVKTQCKTKMIKLFDKMQFILKCGCDPTVTHGKPHPEPFLLSKAKFLDGEPESSKCLVFEDSVLGVASATSAGMQCVMVPAPWMPNEGKTKATVVISSLTDFKPELFGLPPFEQ